MSRRWRRLQARVRTRLTGAMSLRLRLMLTRDAATRWAIEVRIALLEGNL